MAEPFVRVALAAMTAQCRTPLPDTCCACRICLARATLIDGIAFGWHTGRRGGGAGGQAREVLGFLGEAVRGGVIGSEFGSGSDTPLPVDHEQMVAFRGGLAAIRS